MKNNQMISMQRLSSSVNADKHIKKDNLSKILKSEILNILESYLIIDKDSLSLDIIVNQNGYLELNMNGIAKRSKIIGVLPEENFL